MVLWLQNEKNNNDDFRTGAKDLIRQEENGLLGNIQNTFESKCFE